MSRVLGPVLLVGVWLALWGEITVVNVASGVLAVIAVSLVVRRTPERHDVNPIGLARLLAVFCWRLVSSSATVVVTVLAPTPERRRSGVVRVRLTHSSPVVAAIVADAISLTPGTLTLDTRYPLDANGRRDRSVPPTLYVHVLGLDDPEQVRDDIRGLEQLVLSAVSPSASAAPAAVGGDT
ncbi:MAG: Na+/H+ antiporter subunit E [Actinomycetota bacterium]